MMKTEVSTLTIKSAGQPYLVQRSEGYFEYQLPVSVKGVLICAGSVLLVGNPRGEFELPGGKLELGEEPTACAEREIAEETGLRCTASDLISAWVYEITPSRHVFVIAYGMTVEDDLAKSNLNASEEVGRAEWIPIPSLQNVKLPTPYRLAIEEWACRHSGESDDGRHSA